MYPVGFRHMGKRFAEVSLDPFDLKMLSILQRHGRMSKVELANAIGLSASPCHMRLKKLEDAGYIIGYHAEVDISRLVNITKVFTEIALQSHRSDDFDRFEQAIMKIDEIVECDATGGGIDYLLKIVVTRIDQYQDIMESLLEKNLGISRYYSYIVTKSIKKYQGYPINSLLDAGTDQIPPPRRRPVAAR